MHESSKQRHSDQEGEADGARDEHSELLESYNLSSEQEDSRAKGSDEATQNGNSHLLVGLLHLLRPCLMSRVHVGG